MLSTSVSYDGGSSIIRVATDSYEGLFTPNAGQHFRDEQRRRRSQYDRGTRLAALEEYDYDTAIQHLYSGDAQ
jgi:hypothetical protein